MLELTYSTYQEEARARYTLSIQRYSWTQFFQDLQKGRSNTNIC